jgi:gluconokinase
MGVAGSGKTTVGRHLADALGWSFVDADEVHPPANVAKMARGEPLTEHDREPWLEQLGDLLGAAAGRGEPLVLACSALKARYRDRLDLPASRSLLVYLKATPELAAERLRQRAGHFAGPELVASQFAILQEPTDALVLDVTEPVPVLVERIRGKLACTCEGPHRRPPNDPA